MIKQYSIAEARHNLTSIVYELEQMPFVELTRRHKPVAVLLSIEAFNRLQAKERGFFEALKEFRNKHDLKDLGISSETFSNLRDPSPGRVGKS